MSYFTFRIDFRVGDVDFSPTDEIKASVQGEAALSLSLRTSTIIAIFGCRTAYVIFHQFQIAIELLRKCVSWLIGISLVV